LKKHSWGFGSVFAIYGLHGFSVVVVVAVRITFTVA